MAKKRILSILLSIALLLPLFSVCGPLAVEAEQAAVYVDFKIGDDAAAGTQAAPMKTLVAAFNKVNALGLTGDARKVHVLDSYTDVSVALDLTGVNPYNENITLTADYGKTIWFTSELVKLGGPLTIDAKIGKVWNTAMTIYTYGYDLVLGENFEDSYYGKRTEGTIVYAGFDYATQAANATVESGRYQLGRNNNLTIQGSKTGVATIYFGNKANYGSSYIPVQYGDANLVINNPNMTINYLKIGNSTNNTSTDSTLTGGKYETQTCFNSLKIKVDNVAAINSFVMNSWQCGAAANSLQAIFNNGTYAKIASTNNFNWFGSDWTKNGFVCSSSYVMKSAAILGSSLDFTDTPGTFAVNGDLTAKTGTGTASIYSAGDVLTVSKNVEYFVTYGTQISDMDGQEITNTRNGYTIAVNTPPAKLPIAVKGDGTQVVIADRHLVVPESPVKNYTNNAYTNYITYRKPLTNTYNKIQNDQKLTVSFMGGSVTIGTGSETRTGWAQRSEKWFRSTFTDATFTFRNVGSGESGTYLATYRVVQDVISQSPDLFVIEYAINDFYKLGDGYNASTGTVDKTKAAAAQKQAASQYETIIREVKAALPNCDIVTVLTTDQNVHKRAEAGLYDTELYPTAAGHAAIAEKYNISVVNVGESLADYIDSNGLSWSTYYGDVVHPKDTGYEEYYKCFKEYLANELTCTNYTGVTGGRDVLIPVQSDTLLDGNRVMAMAGESIFYPANQTTPTLTPDAFDGYMTAQNGFSFNSSAFQYCYATTYFGYYATSTAGASITFKFSGTEFSFWNNYYGLKNYNSSGYGYKVVRVSDGATVKSGTNTFESHAPSQVVSGLPSDTYTITITPNLASDGSGVIPFQIGAIFFRDATKQSVKGDIDYYADGTECLSLSLPSGKWTIRYADANNVIATIPTPAANGKAFLGWVDESGAAVSSAPKSGAVLTARTVAVDTALGKDLSVTGAQMRTSGEQALRFIVGRSNALTTALQNGGVTILEEGTLVLPTELKENNVLTHDTDQVGVVVAENTFETTNTHRYYTACVTNITDKYTREYTVRGYVKYTDLNGNVGYVYSEEYATCLYDVAVTTLAEKRDQLDAVTITELERVVVTVEG